MARYLPHYAVLVLADAGKPAVTRFFTASSRADIRRAMDTLAKPYDSLETGIWSIHNYRGLTIEAHTYSSFTSRRWRRVPNESRKHYDLNDEGRRQLHLHRELIT